MDNSVNFGGGQQMHVCDGQRMMCQGGLSPYYVLDLANCATMAQSQAHQLARELDHANYKLAQLQRKEEAFSFARSCNGRVYTVDPTGRFVEVLDHEIEFSFFVKPQHPIQQTPYYVIKLKHVEKLAILSERQFSSDARLIQVLQSLPGVHVRQNGSTRRTAYLLREAMDIETVTLNYYGGWQEMEGQGYQFLVFEPMTTWRRRIDEGTHAVQPVAGESGIVGEFLSFLHQMSNAPLRDGIALWFHLAAMVTLVDELGYPFRLGLCLEAAESRAFSWLRSLFGWFSEPIALDLLPRAFDQAMICRKDEPALVLERRGAQRAGDNAARLNLILSAWQIPLSRQRNRDDVEAIPLRALPVILTSAVSSFSCNPRCLAMEIKDTDLGGDYRIMDKDLLHRYLRAFLCFAQEHVAHFGGLLLTKTQELMKQDFAELDEFYLGHLAVLLALKSLLDDFARSMGAAGFGWTEETEEWLTGMLVQTCWKEELVGALAGQFVAIARSMIVGGSLRVSSIEYREHPGACAVYYDEDSLSFTRGAFATVCKQLDASGATVLRSLVDAGLLLGKPINTTTPMTRISVWNQYGIRTTVAVYRLRRDAFETLGEPLIFDGGEE